MSTWAEQRERSTRRTALEPALGFVHIVCLGVCETIVQTEIALPCSSSRNKRVQLHVTWTIGVGSDILLLSPECEQNIRASESKFVRDSFRSCSCGRDQSCSSYIAALIVTSYVVDHLGILSWMPRAPVDLWWFASAVSHQNTREVLEHAEDDRHCKPVVWKQNLEECSCFE